MNIIIHNLECVLGSFLKLARLFCLFLILQRVNRSLFNFQIKSSDNHLYSFALPTYLSFSLSFVILDQQNVFNTSQLSWFNSLAASRFGIFDLCGAGTGCFKNICTYLAHHLIRYHSAGQVRLDSISTKKCNITTGHSQTIQ